jgi:hypothetical protein
MKNPKTPRNRASLRGGTGLRLRASRILQNESQAQALETTQKENMAQMGPRRPTLITGTITAREIPMPTIGTMARGVQEGLSRQRSELAPTLIGFRIG